ncbi:MAG: hypothetical protein RL139_1270 [Gemmatimonadota bacterium]|jgi:DNA-binding NarL/FixJ family response regulator
MTTPRPGTALTTRELDVLRAWVAADFDSAGAAAVIGCTDSAVRQHVRAIQTRTGIHTRRGLERYLNRLRRNAHETEPTQLVVGL